MSFDLRQAAGALGGDIAGGQIIAPGPGHSTKDRSLAVKFDATAPGGFVSGDTLETTGRPAVTT